MEKINGIFAYPVHLTLLISQTALKHSLVLDNTKDTEVQLAKKDGQVS